MSKALSAIETARPVVAEDRFRSGGIQRRVARLYRLLANHDG